MFHRKRLKSGENGGTTNVSNRTQIPRTLGDRVNFLHLTETTCKPTKRLGQVKVSQQRDTENYD